MNLWPLNNIVLSKFFQSWRRRDAALQILCSFVPGVLNERRRRNSLEGSRLTMRVPVPIHELPSTLGIARGVFIRGRIFWLCHRSTPVLARAWKLTALLSARRIAALVPRGFISVAQKLALPPSLSLSFSRCKTARRKRGASSNHTRIGTVFSELCHNTSGLRAARRFIVSRGTK